MLTTVIHYSLVIIIPLAILWGKIYILDVTL